LAQKRWVIGPEKRYVCRPNGFFHAIVRVRRCIHIADGVGFLFILGVSLRFDTAESVDDASGVYLQAAGGDIAGNAGAGSKRDLVVGGDISAKLSFDLEVSASHPSLQYAGGCYPN